MPGIAALPPGAGNHAAAGDLPGVVQRIGHAVAAGEGVRVQPGVVPPKCAAVAVEGALAPDRAAGVDGVRQALTGTGGAQVDDDRVKGDGRTLRLCCAETQGRAMQRDGKQESGQRANGKHTRQAHQAPNFAAALVTPFRYMVSGRSVLHGGKPLVIHAVALGIGKTFGRVGLGWGAQGPARGVAAIGGVRAGWRGAQGPARGGLPRLAAYVCRTLCPYDDTASAR